MMTMAADLEATWDEADYLARHADVAQAVALKQFPSGLAHYVKHGFAEGRQLGAALPPSAARLAPKMTRECLDPWRYLEITPNNGIKPCCKINSLVDWRPAGPSIEDLRNSKEFQLLRAQLLTGQLSNDCAKCHIRPVVGLEKLSSDVHREFRSAGIDDITKALPLRRLRIEVSTKCNLRCVYCAVSQPSYSPEDMPSSSFDEIMDLVGRQPRDIEIYVNGHGETTFHPEWLKLCTAIIAKGFQPNIITNLAKPLDQDEVACLSGFKEIQVSIDTVDSVQLKNIRRRVKLSTIVENIGNILAAARARHHSPPVFTVSCGVYDLSYPHLEELAEFCISVGISSVTFWQLVKYDDLPDAQNVYPVPTLGKDRISDAIQHLERAKEALERNGLAVVIAGGFLDEWRDLAA